MIDIPHLLQRLSDPFNTESRFYWPLVGAIFLALAAHTAWYLWKPSKPRNPVRDQVETIVYWVDVIALVLLLVFVTAKVRAWMLALPLVAEWAALGYLFFFYARPRFAEWAREERKRRFIPEPRRRARR